MPLRPVETAFHHGGKVPCGRPAQRKRQVEAIRGLKHRRLHKAFLRYHDPDNWRSYATR